MAEAWDNGGVELGEGENFHLGATEAPRALSRILLFKTLGNEEMWGEGEPIPRSHLDVFIPGSTSNPVS